MKALRPPLTLPPVARRSLLALSVALTFLFCSPLSAVVIDTAAFSTLQAAVNAAGPGDTVLVPNGTYTSGLIIAGKDHIAIVAAEASANVGHGRVGVGNGGFGTGGWMSASATIGPNGTGSCLRIDASVEISLIGFRLAGCGGTGIEITSSQDITLFGNRILASAGPVGIAAQNSQRTRIEGNHMSSSSVGISILSNQGTIADNTVTGFTDAGIRIGLGSSFVRIVNNRVDPNGTTVAVAAAIGILDAGSETIMVRNTVHDCSVNIATDGTNGPEVTGNDLDGQPAPSGSAAWWVDNT